MTENERRVLVFATTATATYIGLRRLQQKATQKKKAEARRAALAEHRRELQAIRTAGRIVQEKAAAGRYQTSYEIENDFTFERIVARFNS